ncbi:hypothetical protein THIOM_002094 [Candidatus Thiomargarita nelsonii]|uniref:Uncharacterized protein n=1 Tax=Candidatus Thiomargarita nelsonii TaxID=1003181 RepID=A0A176S2F6_9GAMM|nr:hypothetical protein THIOM_002094 [Candidatus Thiomargarita nelsonii]
MRPTHPLSTHLKSTPISKMCVGRTLRSLPCSAKFFSKYLNNFWGCIFFHFMSKILYH